MTNELEIDVRAFCRQLYNEQVAYLFKVPEEMRQTPCDFFGFTRSGRAVLLECKQVKRKSLPIGNSPGIQAHQWTALRQAHDCGAHSILIWRNYHLTTVLTFAQLAALSEGRRSVQWFEDWPWQERLRHLLNDPQGS